MSRSKHVTLILATVLIASCGAQTAPSDAPTKPANDATADQSPSGAATTIPALGDVPFYKGDAARSGVHPGPGPIAEPVEVWQTGIECAVGSNTPVLGSGHLLIGCDANRLMALDARTGALEWTADLSGSVRVAPAIADGAVFVTDTGGTLSSLDLGTGAVRWSIALTSQADPIVVEGTVYAGTSDGKYLGLDPADGAVTWSWSAPAGVAVGRATVLDGTAYIATDDGTLRAVALADGSERWQFRVASGRASSTAINDDTIFTAALLNGSTSGGELYALDRATGVERWRYGTDSGGQIAPPTTADGVTYAPSDGDGFFALDGVDGTVRWNVPTDPMGGQAPVITADAIYVAMDRSVGAFSRADGTSLWEFDLEADVDGSAVVSGGMVFIGDNAGRVRALAEPGVATLIEDAAAAAGPTPTVAPSFDPGVELVATFDTSTSELDYPYGMDIGPDGYLYVVNTWKSEVIVLDPADGSIVRRWGSKGDGPGQFAFQREPDDPYTAIGGVAVGDDGMVYVADTANRRVQQFEPDGTFLRTWGRFGTRDGHFVEPIDVAIGPDGDVFVVDDQLDAIQRFTSDGTFLARIGKHGTEPGQMNFTGSITVGPDGTLYNADWDNNRVQAWADDGTFLWTLGELGENPGAFVRPTDLALDDAGRMHVADLNRLQTFDPSRALVGVGPSQKLEISNLASGDGFLYLSDVAGNRILRYAVLD